MALTSLSKGVSHLYMSVSCINMRLSDFSQGESGQVAFRNVSITTQLRMEVNGREMCLELSEISVTFLFSIHDNKNLLQ